MKKKLVQSSLRLALLGLLISLFSGATHAQDQSDTPHSQPPHDAGEQPPPPQPVRDPTHPSPELLRLISPPPAGVTAGTAARRLPAIRLIGRVIGQNGSSTLILEIEGELARISVPPHAAMTETPANAVAEGQDIPVLVHRKFLTSAGAVEFEILDVTERTVRLRLDGDHIVDIL